MPVLFFSSQPENLVLGTPVDQFNLRERYCLPQKRMFAVALSEIELGKKVSHWSWYILVTPPWLDEHGPVNIFIISCCNPNY